MYKIKADKLLGFTTEQLWKNLEGDFILVFDKAEELTNHRQVIYSSYVWDMIRRYPKTPLTPKHLVKSVMREDELPANAHLSLINSVLWDVFDAYVDDYADPRILIDELSLLAYQITNRLYNELSVKLEAYVTTLDITDFVAITKHPDIERAQIEAENYVRDLYGSGDYDPTKKDRYQAAGEVQIKRVTSLIEDKINNAPELRGNALAIALRTGIAKRDQALQCLGPRGYVQDVDSMIFPKPVMSGYIHGHRLMYSSMIESRSAALSLMNTTKPLQDSEYFSRRQQLVCMNIRNLHMCDCGSQHYLVWNVRGERFDGVTKIQSDLDTIAGKFYLDEETGKLKIVRRGDTHLIGKTLKIRSVSAGCMHPDPNGVCYVCYGETGLALPLNSNLGHAACVTMTAILGQLILSTKHYLSSATVEGINLNSKPVERKYLSADANGSTFYLNQRLKGKTVKLEISVEDAKGLPDLRLVDDVNSINLERTSQFGLVYIIIIDGEHQESTSLNVQAQHRLSSLSPEALAYIKRKGSPVVVRDSTRDARYQFDMTEWDYSQPLFVLPMRQFNMSNHQGEIAKMLESTAEDMEKRSKHVRATNMLIEFHDLVNRRLSVNLSVLDTIIYSTMVVDVDTPNYDLPKPWTSSGLGVLKLLISNRSLSATMAYQGHRVTFTDPSSFVVKNRLDHPFDVIFAPKEVLAHKQRLAGQVMR